MYDTNTSHRILSFLNPLFLSIGFCVLVLRTFFFVVPYAYVSYRILSRMSLQVNIKLHMTNNFNSVRQFQDFAVKYTICWRRRKT